MTPAALKRYHLMHHPDSFFFHPDNMRHAGDTMENYGVRKATVTLFDNTTQTAWELYREHPVKYGNKSPVYFNAVGFDIIKSYKEATAV